MYRYVLYLLLICTLTQYCMSDTCTLKVAICIDVSTYNKHPDYNNNDLGVIKQYINYNVIEHLLNYTSEIAIYTYSGIATKYMAHTPLSTNNDVDWVRNKVNDIQLDFSSTTYADWYNLYDTLYNDYYNDVVLFFNDGYSRVYNENNSTFHYNIDSVIPISNSISSKIISIGIDVNGIDGLSNIQAISGPVGSRDYALLYNITNSPIVDKLHFILGYMCCYQDKDQCGVCHGFTDDHCDGCDGVVGSNKEYDVCGVCGGDSSSCNIPPCHAEANITVTDFHKCKCVYSICSNVEWVKNIWLQSGDVIVEFVTFIHKHSPYDNAYLGNARMNRYEETGIPYHFTYEDTECQKGSDINYCRQVWRFRTYGATGVLNFSGIKPVQFDLVVNGHQESVVNVEIVLNLFKISDPKIYNLIGPSLEVFYDDKYYNPYINNNLSPYVNNHYDFVEGEYVYAKFDVNDGQTSLNIDKIILCTGKNGNPVQYDPSSPHNTGCNTKNVDMIVIPLYDKAFGFSNDKYDFSFGGHGQNWINFKYKSKIYSYYDQILLVYWNYEVSHQISRSVNSEFYDIKNRLNNQLRDQISLYETYSFNYPKELYMKPLHPSIVTKRWKEIPAEKLMMDKRENEANNVNMAIYHVSCKKGLKWVDNVGSCQPNIDSNRNKYNVYDLGYNYLLLMFVLLIVVFAFVWFCSNQ